MPTDPTRAQVVFVAAAEMTDPAARALFVAEACGGDLRLQSRVEALLRAHDQPDSLLDAPLVAPPDPEHAATRACAPNLDSEATGTSAGGTDPCADEPLTFLSPSTRPGSLGRLGHYEMLQVLGRGGFGIVFRAFDDMLQRVVAVKVMATQMATLSPARKRFLREARSSAAIRHENVVHVYEVGEQPLPYLVMEIVPGETLQQKLDRNGPLEVPEVLRIGRQIAEGLAAAHASDLIHRDIKPGNILLEGGSQKVKITDFGLARAADDASISQSGVIAGTPLFMAPEQALGHHIDQRADLFSLGSVLYQMVSGRPPFRAPTALAVLKRVAEETPRPIPEIIPETPQWLCRIVEKLHAKNPDERYQSAREVAEVLADCEKQLQAHAGLKDFTLIPGGKPPMRRARRWKWAVVGLALLALASGAIIAAPHFLPWRGTATVEERLVVVNVEELDAKEVCLRIAGKEFVFDRRGEHQIRVPVGRHKAEWVKAGKPALVQDVYVSVSGETRLTVRAWPVPPAPEGFVQLFNGKDLTGWKMRPGKPGNWQVIDGILVGSKDLECLFSPRDDYQNFHLRAEVAVGRGGLADIWFRAETPPEPLSPIPPNPIRKPTGYTAHIDLTGGISFRNPQTGSWTTQGTPDIVKPDAWYTLEVVAEGNHLVTKVNGVTAVDFVEPLDAYKKGHIALQLRVPDSVVRFRRIEIKELPAAESDRP